MSVPSILEPLTAMRSTCSFVNCRKVSFVCRQPSVRGPHVKLGENGRVAVTHVALAEIEQFTSVGDDVGKSSGIAVRGDKVPEDMMLA